MSEKTKAVGAPLERHVRRFDASLEDVIYRIEPVDSPFFAIFKYGRFTFRSGKGGSMRKQRRRKAKPLRFTAATRASRIVREWHLDTLQPWPSA